MLRKQGIRRAVAWTRGIDRSVFLEREGRDLGRRPILLYAGRVSSEKNLPAFLKCPVRGTKVVVGDGPIRGRLEKQFPDVRFLGWRFGEELAEVYSSADVLVFPSKTDTFGMVMIEANACGTPVAAHDVCGPVDIVRNGENGWLDADLSVAIQKALDVPRESCARSSLVWDWGTAAEMLLKE